MSFFEGSAYDSGRRRPTHPPRPGHSHLLVQSVHDGQSVLQLGWRFSHRWVSLFMSWNPSKWSYMIGCTFLSCAKGHSLHQDRVWQNDCQTERDMRHSGKQVRRESRFGPIFFLKSEFYFLARNPICGRDRRAVAWLHPRGVWQSLFLAEPWSDRRERPRQPERLQDARGLVRIARREETIPHHQQVSGSFVPKSSGNQQKRMILIKRWILN